MLQFEWPHKWSEQDCESVRISIERSIRDAMARGSGNAQIRGLVSVDTPNLGKRPPKIKLEGIRCLSLNRTAINLHIQYDGDFEITLRGLQVNLDTLNTSSTNDLDGSKAMPFFCPFILTVTNLVLDGMASVEIRQEVQRDWTGLHQISPTLDAFMLKNSARQSQYEYYNAHDYQEHVNDLRGNRKQWLQQASQHGEQHVPTFKVSKHRQLAMERRKVTQSASRNLVSSNDNCNTTTTFNETEYKDRYKSLSAQLSSPNIKEESEFTEVNSTNKFYTLSNEQNDKYYEMPDRCVSTGASETASSTLTSTSTRPKLGYGVLFATGGRHVMRKPHAQQNAFTGLEYNYNDQGMEHRYASQTNINSGYCNELHRSREPKMYQGSNINKTNRTTLNQYNVSNNDNNNSGLNVNHSHMHVGNNCVEFIKGNAGLKDEAEKRKTLLNYETHHHEECNDRKHWLDRNDARMGSSYATHEQLQKGVNSNDCNNCYKYNKYNKFRPSEYECHDDDNIKNNINSSNNDDDIHNNGDDNFVYDESGNILCANVVDLLCHKVKVSKRIIKVQLFGDPLKSFSVISNFGTVPGVDNRVEETIKMLIKPIIERMMLDGLTIVR